MSGDLFRREALLHNLDSRFGDPVFYAPFSVRVLCVLASAIVLSFVVLAANAQIRQSERVLGFMLIEHADLRLYSPYSGIVTDIFVEEGEVVRRGDVIATVVNNTHFGTNDLLSARQLDYLTRLIQTEQLQSEQAQALASLEQQRLLAAISAGESELTIARQEFELLQQRVELLMPELNAAEHLFDRAMLSRSEMNQRRAEKTALLQQQQALTLALSTRQQTLEDMRLQLKALVHSTAEQSLSQQNTLLRLQLQHEEIAVKGHYMITATASGRIDNLVLDIGQQLDTRSPVATIQKNAAAMSESEVASYEARLFLPSRSRGQIEAGQTVALRIDAFPYQRWGTFAAEVVSVASTLTDPREYLLPVELNEPAYVVRARLLPGGPDVALQSGMQVSAEIITGRQTLLQKVTAPLKSLEQML